MDRRTRTRAPGGRPRSRAEAGRRPRTARRCRPRRGLRARAHGAASPSRRPTCWTISAATTGRGPIRVDHDHAVGLPVADSPEALPHPLVELERQPLEGVARGERAAAGAGPAEALGDVEVQHQRQVGHEAVRGQLVQLGDGLERQAPPVAPGRRPSSPRSDRRGRPRPAASAGRMTRWTCSARLAAKSRASVRGVTRSTSARTRRSEAPSGVPSGSAVATTDTSRAASQARRPSTWWTCLPLDALDGDQATPGAVGTRGRHGVVTLSHAGRGVTRRRAAPQQREDAAAEARPTWRSANSARGGRPRAGRTAGSVPQAAPAAEVGRRVDDEAAAGARAEASPRS